MSTRTVYWVNEGVMLAAEVPVKAIAIAHGAPCPSCSDRRIKALDYRALTFQCSTPDPGANATTHHFPPLYLQTTDDGSTINVYRAGIREPEQAIKGAKAG